ncbi:MAG: S-layer homology domain-containing protein [Clostridiales bacterium]|jgi:hypothetical protein|nr:S-layer homology domain-containing protein [Clostridiales bacterium]
MKTRGIYGILSLVIAAATVLALAPALGMGAWADDGAPGAPSAAETPLEPGTLSGTEKSPELGKPSAPETPSAAMPFGDVGAGDWYYGDVAWAHEQGLMSGAGENPPLFSPGAPMTRAMLVTVLYRFAGEPAVRMNLAFGDVKEGEFFYQAVNWAKEFGIVAGVGGDLFDPGADITREQLAAILLNYAKYRDKGPVGAWAVRLPFGDVGEISDWAVGSAMWCSMKGIVAGRPGGLFDPQGAATRAEAAAMLHRLSAALAAD